MADEKKQKQYVEEPIERTPQSAGGKNTATLVEEPIERAAPPANQGSSIPENYGFTASHMLDAAKEGLVSLGRGALSMGHDVLTNPDWLVGQGKTTLEKLSDPNTTFNRFIGTPSQEEHGKASRMWRELKDQSRTTGRAPIGKIAEMGGHELASLVPIFGPWAASLGERAGSGDIGGAAAEGGTQAVAGAAVPKVIGKVAHEVSALPRIWRGLKTLGETTETAKPPTEIAPVKPATPAKVAATPAAEPPVSFGTQPARPAKTPYFNPEGMEPSAPEIKPIGKAPETAAPTRLPTLFEKGTKPSLPKLNDLVDQAAGVKPLKPDVPLREQLTPQPTQIGEVVDPIKAKYPDPAVRQMVRANGEAIYEAAKGDPATVKAIHDLTRVDLRQALVRGGENMGQQTVSNSKFAGEGSIPREEAFNRLLKKGYTPQDILKMAKDPELAAGESTADRYQDPTTKEWSHERQVQHDAIARAAVEGKTPPVGRPPEATITMGGTASGKTTAARGLVGENPNLVNVDSDTNKLHVPEYENLKKTDPQRAAARVHEESTQISKRMIQETVKRGLDFLYDTSTGGGGEALFKRLKDLGYKVKLVYTDIPADEAVTRAGRRAVESTDPTNRGRFVPEEVIRAKHQEAANAFQKAKGSPHIDEVHAFDTTARTPAKFYERLGNTEKVYNEGVARRVAEKAGAREAQPVGAQ